MTHAIGDVVYLKARIVQLREDQAVLHLVRDDGSGVLAKMDLGNARTISNPFFLHPRDLPKKGDKP